MNYNDNGYTRGTVSYRGKRTFHLAYAHRDIFLVCQTVYHHRCAKRLETKERDVPVDVDVEHDDVQRAERSDVSVAAAVDEPAKHVQPTAAVDWCRTIVEYNATHEQRNSPVAVAIDEPATAGAVEADDSEARRPKCEETGCSCRRVRETCATTYGDGGLVPDDRRVQRDARATSGQTE